MKPKNRIYCREIGRTKLVFETEKKALTFIKFNADEIEQETGRKPTRAYYCECCGGWHTTSMQDVSRLKFNRLDKVINAYNSTIKHPEIENLIGVTRNKKC